MPKSREDRYIDIVVYSLLALLALVTIYPFWNSIVISFNEGSDTAAGGITVWPRVWTLDNYEYVFRDNRIVNAFIVTVSRTLVGTALSIFFTAIFGYAMARRGLVGKKFYMILCVITLYFHGGLIPTYLLMRDLQLMNTFWVLVIPTIISVWNMIIFRTFFQEIPDGLEESAKMDGASNIGVFFRIIVPVSGPAIATLSLFTAVFHWNAWFDASIYITNTDLVPLQTHLVQIISEVLERTGQSQQQMSNTEAEILGRMTVTHKSIVMATMMVAAAPIMLVYPFVQKYFVKGVMVGSLKG